MRSREEAIAQLTAAELVSLHEGRLRTTRRWQGALARAAARLYAEGAPWKDLRLPIVETLVEVLSVDDDTLVACVEVMLGVEVDELGRGLLRPAETDPR
jgi:hypothetical protein